MRIFGHDGERHVFRCSICNKVNNQDIETDLGDFNSKMSYVPDPKSPDTSFICIECDEAVREHLSDFQLMDEYANA